MKTINVLTRQSVFLGGLLLLMAEIVLSPFGWGHTAMANDPLKLEVAFDNPQAEANREGERVLELLVTSILQPNQTSVRSHTPLNIVLVIDTSGSMAQERKLETVKSAAQNILGYLRPGDNFALVTYDNSARVCIPSEPVENLAQAHQMIDALQPGGSTNLSAGLEEGYRQFHRHHDPTMINRVFLLSDGLANMGEVNPVRLGASVEREAQRGISLSTFGVGLEFNETLMAELSERGRGMYHFIDEPERIKEVFAHAFKATQEMVAQDVQLTVSLIPSVKVTEVFANSYQTRDNTIIIQAGDLSAGELRRIQLRVETAKFGQGSHEIGQVRIRYQLPGTSFPITQSQPLVLQYGYFGLEIDRSRDRGITERTKVFEAHYARNRAAEVFDRGDSDTAKRILHESLEKLRNAKVHGQKISRELNATSTYLQSLEQQLNRHERTKSQKTVKYKKYLLEGC
ncbi:MAG: VWA domain-containing protein [Desulfobulbus sp.]|nr:VWA domain-containing protein [Desulfobulbus sp.]